MNELQKRQTEDTIDLLEVVKYVYKYRRLVLISTVMGLLAGIVFSVISFMRGEMSKKYVIKTSIAVTSQTEDGLFTSQSNHPNSADIHLAEDMVDSVIFVIRSDRTLEATVDQLKLVGITSKDIYDNLYLSQYNQTQIIDLSLYWRNAEEGIKILEALNEVSPEILVDILKIGDVRVVNDPKAKYLIGGSVNAALWLLMTLAGMGVGIVIAVVLMSYRPTVINPSDVPEKLGVKLLGEIPKDKLYRNLKGDLFLAEYEKMSRDVKEGYLSAAHLLRREMEHHDCRVIFLTSTQQQEGKTSAAAHLAMNLADFEKRVLLIDMDLVSPNLGGRFLEEIDYEHTLNAVYHGDSTMREASVPLTGYLHILPLIHDNSEIILHNGLLEMIRKRSEDFDYTIIDTSAVGETSAVLGLKALADAALFVVRHDYGTTAQIGKTLQLLKDTDIPVLGCMVTQIDGFPGGKK